MQPHKSTCTATFLSGIPNFRCEIYVLFIQCFILSQMFIFAWFFACSGILQHLPIGLDSLNMVDELKLMSSLPPCTLIFFFFFVNSLSSTVSWNEHLMVFFTLYCQSLLLINYSKECDMEKILILFSEFSLHVKARDYTWMVSGAWFSNE